MPGVGGWRGGLDTAAWPARHLLLSYRVLRGAAAQRKSPLDAMRMNQIGVALATPSPPTPPPHPSRSNVTVVFSFVVGGIRARHNKCVICS